MILNKHKAHKGTHRKQCKYTKCDKVSHRKRDLKSYVNYPKSNKLLYIGTEVSVCVCNYT